MSIRRMSKKGFTLVEILIVVIILGILAAIVIPQFTNASQDARKSSLASQLQTMRSQIELYKLQHKDVLPDLITDFSQLTNKTDSDGVVGTTPDVHVFGPYLQADPVNPLNGFKTVVDGIATATTTNAGFVYDYQGGAGTGKIWGTDETGDAVFIE